MDIQSYMHSVGRAARAASRDMAKAETAAKNQALLSMADAIERDVARLLDANRKDVEAASGQGPRSRNGRSADADDRRA